MGPRRRAFLALLVASGCSAPPTPQPKVEPPPTVRADSGASVPTVGEPTSLEPEDLWIPYGFQLVRDKEPLDSEWAPRTEHALRERFENTPDRRLVAIECRRMTCLIAFIIRPPEKPTGPHLDWAGAQWGTTWDRSDGWTDVYLVNKRHPMDRPDASARIVSHAAANSPAACRSGRRGFDSATEYRTCFVTGTAMGAGPLCFQSFDDACACQCAKLGLAPSSCGNQRLEVSCTGLHRNPDWKVEHFPPLRKHVP